MRMKTARSIWTRALKRQIAAVTRNSFVARAKVLKPKGKVLKHQTAKKRVVGQSDSWRAGTAASADGIRRYQLFIPSVAFPAPGRPLIVMLHGCAQDGRGMALSTRMNRLAGTANFMVLYPEQDRLSNVHACWNWFDTRAGRAQREMASIVSTIDQVCATHAVDTSRIVLVGMSAGASMAALMALENPARYLAVAMHSGVGPGLAHSTGSALAAMRGRIPKEATPLADEKSALPPLMVIHGMRDGTVSPSNGLHAAQCWATTTNAKETASRAVQRGSRYAATWRDWKKGNRVMATLVEVAGLGHAWSGGARSQAFSDPDGPDASRMVWAFAQRAHTQRAAMVGV